MDTSLQRYKTSNRKEINSMSIPIEQTLIDTYSGQEIPTCDELKGLQVSIIKSQTDYNNEVKRLQRLI